MKIRCSCGGLIIDQTDSMSDKAYFIADQDLSDMYEAVRQKIEKMAGAVAESIFDEAETKAAVEQTNRAVYESIRKYKSRNLYQCSNCGMLMVDDENYNCHAFAPVNEDAPRNLLRSIEGNNWKRPLRASWNSQSFGSWKKGSLSWGFGVEDEGFEEFDDYETLERTYFEVFQRLLENDILRSAYFSKDGVTVHSWSPGNSGDVS